MNYGIVFNFRDSLYRSEWIASKDILLRYSATMDVIIRTVSGLLDISLRGLVLGRPYVGGKHKNKHMWQTYVGGKHGSLEPNFYLD